MTERDLKKLMNEVRTCLEEAQKAFNAQSKEAEVSELEVQTVRQELNAALNTAALLSLECESLRVSLLEAIAFARTVTNKCSCSNCEPVKRLADNWERQLKRKG